MERKCKNKKCQKILPEDYKYKYCEHCRNKRSDTLKQVRNVAGGLLVVALTVVTKGNFKPKK